MTEMMELEAGEAAIIEKTPSDCKKLESELATYSKSTADKRRSINVWWDDLSKGKRKKLVDSHASGKYRLAMAMMRAAPCLDSIKRGMKAGS